MIYVILTAVFILVDQFTKVVSMKNLTHKGISLIDGVLSLSYVRNSGAAWGIFSGKTAFLVLFTVVIFAVGIWYFIKNPPQSKLLRISLSLISAGGLGNMIDRVFRDGSVIDMIKFDFIDFPVFNFADICVCIGAFLFCIAVLFFDKNDNKTEENDG